jgi:isopenicillin-N epimerase
MHAPPPFGRAARSLWMLEEGMTFLNHGAFGATPRQLLAAQDRVRTRMERQPLRFFVEEAAPGIRSAADAIAGYLGADGQDIALCENTTAGVNAVLHSFPLGPGDRVLACDHVYPAVAKTLARVVQRTGATLDEVTVPYPVSDPGEVVEAFAAGMTDRTRLVVVDHVTSMTALVFPVAEIVALARARGVPVLVDGAHAPGMVPLDLPALGATWYVGNCHKWLCAPKGTAILWANPADPTARAVRPTVVSHLAGQPFPAEFDWVGTRDLTAWLTLPDVVAFRRWLGDEAVRAWCHDRAVEGARAIAAAIDGDLGGPASMLGSMAPVLVPGLEGLAEEDGVRLRGALWRDERIEVACPVLQGRLTIRISGQIYNEPGACDRLAEVLPATLGALF